MIGDGPKMVDFGPNMAGLSTFQSVFDYLGPGFWAHLDPFKPFQTKNDFLPQIDKVGFGVGASEQKSIFV